MDPIRQARIDLAAALRWAERLGLNEGIDPTASDPHLVEAMRSNPEE
jgi:hypothetical protein